MNGDPRKPEIASAQTYFALKTREAEISSNLVNSEVLITTINAALEQALTPINQQLSEIQQQLKLLPGAKPKRPWTLPPDTPLSEVPEGYQQLQDGSWLSPEAYQSILRQSRLSLPWELRKFRNFE